MAERKKLLVVIQLIRRGGVELVAINFALNLDASKYDVTILLINPSEGHDEELAKQITDAGIKIVGIDEGVSGYVQKFKYLNDFFKRSRFDIVHSHTIFFSGIVMLAAKMNGVKVRASHSHIIKWNREENLLFKIYKALMRFLINICSTELIACSTQSGIYLYGKRAFEKRGRFIANGINTKSYAFDKSIGEAVRKELGIKSDTLLLGHIGSIYRIKNQVFLAEIFASMLKRNSNMKLLLVGEEFDGEPVREKIKELGIENDVIFAGKRNDIARVLQAMDIMIFPSLFEALPVSLIEAQSSKLPCLISDSVTREVKFNINVDFLSLEKPADIWADRAFELLEIDRDGVDISELVKAYDISSVTKILDEIYLS